MTAGYSGRPLTQKLGLVAGMSIAVLDPPEDFDEIIPDWPAGVRRTTRLGGHRDAVLVFATRHAELARRVPALIDAVRPDGMVWVIWPKRASKVLTDLTEDVIRDVVLPSGLVDVKVCAVDQRWSGLKLVIRKKLR